jgi:hypothetical protein
MASECAHSHLDDTMLSEFTVSRLGALSCTYSISYPMSLCTSLCRPVSVCLAVSLYLCMPLSAYVVCVRMYGPTTGGTVDPYQGCESI